MAPKRRSQNEKQVQEKKVKQDLYVIEHKINELSDIGNLMRIECIEMTQCSKSGHPTSCSSIADIFSCLFFSKFGLKLNVSDPSSYENERLVLSKGHAAPILYSAWK